MRNTLRRIAFGVLATGMVATMAMTASTTAASAAVVAHRTETASLQPALTWPLVRRGDFGPRVVKIQFLLNQHGIHVKVDGKFGPRTQAAVRLFQKRSGLFPDGIVGPLTWGRLIVTVRRGSRGFAVKAVQFELRFVYGYRFVNVDGVFGPLTEWAVKLFQRRFGLFPDGIVGPFTWNALVVNEA